MTGSSERMTGGQALVEVLRRNGVDRVFCVPGESFLPVLDALFDADDIDLVVCRQEGAAAMMAEAHGKLTGRPGVLFVTRGPGSANAMSGLHVAAQDSTPLLVFVGQVPTGFVEREAWQEIDPRGWFGAVAKWAAQVQDTARLAEYVSRAFHTATAGRPGPVVLGLPEDVLAETAVMPDLAPARAPRQHPARQDMERLADMLGSAERPLAVLGGSGWSREARRQVADFAERHALPVATAFRRQDRIDNRSPVYAGEAGLGMNPRLAERIREADLLLAIGTRLGDIATGHYGLVSVPRPRQRLIHVHSDPEEPGRVYQPDLALCAGIGPFAETLAELAPGAASADRQAWLEAARADYLEWSTPTTLPGPLQLGEIVAWLGRELPDNAVVSNGAGNYTLWVQRFYPFRGYPNQLAPTSGSMGYGLPAAIAAKLEDPDRIAVCFAGDGCLQMTGQELATAVQYGADVIVIVVNNGSYGSIRMHQERQYPGRRYGTDLVNPDFIALAQAYGIDGYRVQATEEFPDAFRQAVGNARPALIELKLDAAILRP